MPNPTKTKRKPRFKREALVSLRLEERDRQIIRLVFEHRFLTSEHILALVKGGRQGILRRLQRLFHAGYLDRPKIQLARLGNFPMVYAVGNQGAKLLSLEFDVPAGKADWTSKNREAGGVFLEHTLMITEFLAIMRLACQRVKGLEFIEPAEIISRRPTLPSLAEKPLSWSVRTGQGAENQGRGQFNFSLVPDGVFGLRFTDEFRRKEAYFFLEADRSTMPIVRNNLLRSSFYKKMIGYWSSWQSASFEKNFGFKSPLILTLTLSDARIKNMIEANKHIDPRGRGSRMFLFARAGEFSLSDPLKVFDWIWLNGRGERARLID